MLDFIKNELKKQNIELVSSINLDECIITRPHLLERHQISKGSVAIFAVPYLTKESTGKRNISSYAVSRDYHIFFKDLFDDLTCKLKENFHEFNFIGFADHSPINEIDAAAKAKLGVIGTNHLLITEKYSSYVFIGEIITDATIPSCAGQISHCIDCKKCVISCPVHNDLSHCLSAITQKKGELDKTEKNHIKSRGCAWGCDICQEVCPYTVKAIQNGTIYTDVDFFKSKQTPHITYDDIENMNEEDFAERAYSWRGKKVISRNLLITEGKES